MDKLRKWHYVILTDKESDKLKKFLKTLAVYHDITSYYDLKYFSIKVDPNSIEFNLINQLLDCFCTELLIDK